MKAQDEGWLLAMTLVCGEKISSLIETNTCDPYVFFVNFFNIDMNLLTVTGFSTLHTAILLLRCFSCYLNYQSYYLLPRMLF